MENIVKFRAAQASFDTSGSKNMVDFFINEGSGVMNMDKSYINVSVRMNADSTATVVPNKIAARQADDSCVYDPHMEFNEANRRGFCNTATGIFVKNAEMVCKRGKVESVRNNDVLRVNRAVYLKDFEEQRKNIQGYQKGVDGCGNLINFSGYNELYKEGAVRSRVRDHEIKIPLSQIVNIAEAKDEEGNAIGWSTASSDYGRTQLHLEMNFDKMVLGENVFTTAAAGIWDRNVEATGVNYETLNDFTCAVANEFRSLTTTAAYADLNDSPFYTGMKLAFTSTGGTGHAGTALAATIGVIHALTHNQNGTITMDLGNDLVNNGTVGQTWTGITCVGSPAIANESSITINKCELVATMMNGAASYDDIEYTTFVNENDSVPQAQTRITKSYLVEANCRCVYVAFPKPAGVYSSEPLTSYRFSLDNKDVTNRVVYLHSPLHKDLLGRAFKNEGRLVKNMRERVPPQQGSATASGDHVFMLGLPVPLLDRPQRLGVEFEYSGAHSGQIALYKEVIRVI